MGRIRRTCRSPTCTGQLVELGERFALGSDLLGVAAQDDAIRDFRRYRKARYENIYDFEYNDLALDQPHSRCRWS